MGKRGRWTGLLIVAMAACSSGELGEGERTFDDVPESELLYLRDQGEVAAAFEDGYHDLIPVRAFEMVDVVYVDLGDRTPEYQVYANGAFSEWAPLVPERLDTVHRAATIRVATGGQAIRLRGGEGLDFARFEFFADVPDAHAHTFNDDNLGADEHDDAEMPEEIRAKRAHPGRWQISAATASAGNAQNVRYERAPSWSGGRNCSGSLKAGTRALGEYLVANFAGGRSYQGYACRQIRGSSGMSMHGTGRALDLFVPLDRGQADNDLGDPIAQYLIENAENIGIQMIIWDRSIWSTSRNTRFRSYGGAHAHHDHLHIELTAAGANRQTPFFNGGQQPPPAGNPDASPGAPQSWGTCRAGGELGDCLRTSDCTGTRTRGLCPGPNDVQCCTGAVEAPPADPPPADPPPADPPPAEPPAPPQSCSFQGVEGRCMALDDVDACPADIELVGCGADGACCVDLGGNAGQPAPNPPPEQPPAEQPPEQPPADQPADGPCTAFGIQGQCMAPEVAFFQCPWPTMQAWDTPDCQGESLCCIRAPGEPDQPDPPPEERPRPGESDCSVNGEPGVCLSTDTCRADGGQSTPGFCPGPNHIQCCTW